jgi:hypothetical protein
MTEQMQTQESQPFQLDGDQQYLNKAFVWGYLVWDTQLGFLWVTLVQVCPNVSPSMKSETRQLSKLLLRSDI